MNLRVRQRKEEDRAATREINREAFETAYSHIFSSEEIEGLFSDRLTQSATWTGDREGLLNSLVAEDASGIVGFANLARRRDSDGELAALYVLPDHQGRGAGLALWQASLDALWKEGFTGMQVWVLAGVPAVGFYERRGCSKIDEGVYRVGDHPERTLGYRIALSERR